MKGLETSVEQETVIVEKALRACRMVAPLWPLRNFVAVNPFIGLREKPFWEADHLLRRIGGEGLTMDASYYRECFRTGRIRNEDLEEALREADCPLDVADLLSSLETRWRLPLPRISLVTDLASEIDHFDWSGLVVERISHFCATYFDEGQSAWRNPWTGESLWKGWLEFSRSDKSFDVMGLARFSTLVDLLPASPQAMIAMALSELPMEDESLDDYLFCVLSSFGGWASWARYQEWQGELANARNDSLRDLLAVRLAFEWMFMKVFGQETIACRRAGNKEKTEGLPPSEKASCDRGRIVQLALETAYRKEVIGILSEPVPVSEHAGRPDYHAVFCIDVRSEVFRRALETVAPGGRTIGFAGFFGVPLEYVPFGSIQGKSHLPILFAPAFKIHEQPFGTSEKVRRKMGAKRQKKIRIANAFKTFKTSAASCFSYVEAFGLLSLGKLVGDSMGWSRPVPHPKEKGLPENGLSKLKPVIDLVEDPLTGVQTGIPAGERLKLAANILVNMGLTNNFSRIVAMVGHGSTTTNNPHGSSLDCGACGGQTGEVSARIAADLLNDPVTREALFTTKGIRIPDDTIFLAALHDTTTDSVRIFDHGSIPPSHADDVVRLEKAFGEAKERSMVERAKKLGLEGQSSGRIGEDLENRAKNWAHVRPEWGLAGNASFIAAPRSRTLGRNFSGRAFLHDYTWQEDPTFSTLELIMTAPLVVANWINMQYYGSMVDNRRYGSGNKVLHNVVGGSIGVLEGNGGDLRTGLSLQSLSDGKNWVHEPLRLHAFFEAPAGPIDEIIERHELVRNLVQNEWILLFRIDSSGSIHCRHPQGGWKS